MGLGVPPSTSTLYTVHCTGTLHTRLVRRWMMVCPTLSLQQRIRNPQLNTYYYDYEYNKVNYFFHLSIYLSVRRWFDWGSEWCCNTCSSAVALFSSHYQFSTYDLRWLNGLSAPSRSLFVLRPSSLFSLTKTTFVHSIRLSSTLQTADCRSELENEIAVVYLTVSLTIGNPLVIVGNKLVCLFVLNFSR